MTITPRSPTTEQLALLDERGPNQVPSQFVLSEHTRRIGQRHVAEIRRQLLEQAARPRARTLPGRPAAIAEEHGDAAGAAPARGQPGALGERSRTACQKSTAPPRVSTLSEVVVTPLATYSAMRARHAAGVPCTM